MTPDAQVPKSATSRLSGEMIFVQAGQLWRDKSAPWRTVLIKEVYDRPVIDSGKGEQIGIDRYVSVKRNTSRRTQAIKVDTLYAKYRRATR